MIRRTPAPAQLALDVLPHHRFRVHAAFGCLCGATATIDTDRPPGYSGETALEYADRWSRLHTGPRCGPAPGRIQQTW